VICVFEPEALERLEPLCDLRPVFDLRCGRFALLDKLRRLYPREKFALWVRDELAELTREVHPGLPVNAPVTSGCLFVSGRAILHEPIPIAGEEEILVAGEDVVGFRLKAATARKVESAAGLVTDLPSRQVKARVVLYPWHLVEFNVEELQRELHVKGQSGRTAGVVGDRRKLCVAAAARVWPGAVVSTETGPVLIDRGAEVRPGSFIEGPCYVGPGTVIDGAKVRPGCSFGPHCRIGGEVEGLVFQAYSNKHHDGFIGHAFVGEWVNLGALTTNSDLKNAYQPVQVFFHGKAVDTGLLKVGCFIGDHVKTAIGSLINTGARIGTFANWFETGLSPKEIPAFRWTDTIHWPLGQALSNARQVMARRGVQMTPGYEQALRGLYARRSTPAA
jgi:UDP-N-acetylglucosamine diphosphorylase/glucosamine-1-phosphate N-acetyltransferase